MRRGELLNMVWSDIDFEAKTVQVCPKKNTSKTWAWLVKNTDRRTLPLTDEVISMLVEHQARLPEGHPHVFVPSLRYEYIQQLRKQGKWSLIDRARYAAAESLRRDLAHIWHAAS